MCITKQQSLHEWKWDNGVLVDINILCMIFNAMFICKKNKIKYANYHFFSNENDSW